MFSITMNNHTFQIPHSYTKIQALNFMASKMKESHGNIVTLDCRDIGFSFSRDFVLVIVKRFPLDAMKFIVKNNQDLLLAREFSLQAETSPHIAEFDKNFPKKNILAHNMTAWEYFLYEVKRWFLYIFFLLSRKAKKEKFIYMKHQASSSMVLMITWLIISFTLLLFIFHFAVSKTFVYITPQITIKPISANIIYSNASGSVLQWKNVIALRKLTLGVDHSMRFTLDTVDPNSTANAEGRVTIYNELDTPQSLKPFTRFITETGEVFRTKEWISVPASRSLNGITEIGSAEAIIIADLYDESWKIIGKRWNIPAGSDLSIPWLRFNRDKVYAKTKENFTSGSDPKIHVVTDDEVKKFTWILREQLYKTAQAKIQTELSQNKEKLGEDYSLLMGDSITFTGELLSLADGKKIGDSADEITLRWFISVSALIFDKTATIEYLTRIFREWLLHGTDKELAIHPETLRLANLVSRDDQIDATRIKATMEMNASITYDFENVANDLTKHMKVLIAWLPRADAISRLINDGHVKDISISFSPFWIRQVSSNIDNIEFIIKK